MSVIKTWFRSSPDLALSWLPPADTSKDRSSSHDGGSLSSRSPTLPMSPTGSRPPVVPVARDGTFATLERHEASVRRRLQQLLDAQAEGLLAGIGGQEDGAESSESGSMHTTYSTPPSPFRRKVIPVRQPVERPMSLRAARRGIRSAMLELATIKDNEVDAANAALDGTEQMLEQIKRWDDRKKGLEDEMEAIQRSDSTDRIQELREEDHTLQEQINALEMQLGRLRDQQNAVHLELSRISNSVDSKLSSYRQSLRLLDKQVKESLANQTSSFIHESPYHSLPLERRTLALAAEHAQEEREALEKHREILSNEREAVNAGITIWTDAVGSITSFEKALRDGMAALSPAVSGDDDTSAGGQREHHVDMQNILSRMDEVILDLDGKARLADARGWKLLICCIGAELEAFRQGKAILEAALSTARSESGSQEHDHTVSEASEVSSAEERYSDRPAGFDITSDLLRNSTSTIKQSTGLMSRPPRSYDDDDEEPDMDLLVSRADTDTEAD